MTKLQRVLTLDGGNNNRKCSVEQGRSKKLKINCADSGRTTSEYKNAK